ncbi:MAG: amino acid ABC transporter substrate-binding protein [Lachnospiraceae bacterium]|nr:amino acid ABC transporter substrate-binding protein [Lachnospiraceae bacterium]MBR2737093.1 amino acid ABC transporter substrate-binding protein [Lachnospiraceae bacterium]
MKKSVLKILALALVAVMAVSALAACGGSSSGGSSAGTEDTGSAAAPADETAEAAPLTINEGQLIMATNAYFPPYEYYEGEEIVGIDAEIAAAVAERLGLELVIEDIEFDSIIAGIQTGKYDIGLAGMTVTEDRLQSVNFSTPYATGIQSIIVPEGSPITNLDDLLEGDYIVGVQSGTTGDIYMTDDVGEERVDRYSKGNDAVLALMQGKVDAVVIDNQPAIAFVAANEGLMILETPYTVEDYAMAIAKENTALLEQVNAILAELEADGTLQSIIDSYITAE